MVTLSIAGPIIGVLSGLDVILHVYLDYKKTRVQDTSVYREPSTQVPSSALAAATLSTLFAFILVASIPLAWFIEATQDETWYFFELVELPDYIWVFGFVLLCIGIIIHGWSRYVRHEMAASWAMSEEHRLVTTGPYSRVRHPSYTSYFLSFIGLCFLLPSLISLILLVGFWGYHRIAVIEEDHLLQHFGGSYREYMKRTGRFFPGL